EATTANGMPAVRITTHSEPIPTFSVFWQPIDADLIASSIPGRGIFFHGWSLTAEHLVPANRGRDTLQPDDHIERNPRFLWLSSGSSLFAPVDQCLDTAEGRLQDPWPLQLCGPELQVGDIFSTWTYLRVDTSDVRRLLNQSARHGVSGPCGIETVVGRD